MSTTNEWKQLATVTHSFVQELIPEILQLPENEGRAIIAEMLGIFVARLDTRQGAQGRNEDAGRSRHRHFRHVARDVCQVGGTRMSAIRELFDMPPEMARLPRDARGYPVPAFAHWNEDGTPDFRILKQGWREECHYKRKCWLCGGHMGKKMWFVIGPMCSVTRTTMEPPCHRLCAEFAVKNCPFLVRPMAKRNERGLPEEKHVSGIMIERNPGVSIIWETLSYKPFNTENGWLITVGDPVSVTAWREGRPATRDELLESVETGFPALQEVAEKQGNMAVFELGQTAGKWSRNVLDRWFPLPKLFPDVKEENL